MPEPGPKGAYVFTPAPVWNPIVAVRHARRSPTEDFFGWDRFATDGACIRWYQIFRYPRGVRLDEGEDWYLNVHAPEVCKQPGLRRFFSFRRSSRRCRWPGMWHPERHAARRDADGAVGPGHASCGTTASRPGGTPSSTTRPRTRCRSGPPTRSTPETTDTFPFFKPGVDFVSSFILERPADEFKRDTRYYLP